MAGIISRYWFMTDIWCQFICWRYWPICKCFGFKKYITEKDAKLLNVLKLDIFMDQLQKLHISCVSYTYILFIL